MKKEDAIREVLEHFVCPTPKSEHNQLMAAFNAIDEAGAWSQLGRMLAITALRVRREAALVEVALLTGEEPPPKPQVH